MAKGLTIALMFANTVYSVSVIVDSARQTKVGDVLASRTLTGAGCAAIAAISLAFDAVCMYALATVL